MAEEEELREWKEEEEQKWKEEGRKQRLKEAEKEYNRQKELAKARQGKRKAMISEDSREETEKKLQGSNKKVSYYFFLNLVELKEIDKIKTEQWSDYTTLQKMHASRQGLPSEGTGAWMPTLCTAESWL
jgi:hypothetical protein